MNHPRHSEPLPLGTPEHPYSKGLMARALVAVGVPRGRALHVDRQFVGARSRISAVPSGWPTPWRGS